MRESALTPVASKPAVAILPAFVRRQLGLRARSRVPFDDLVQIRFGEDAYMLTDPADIRHVLLDKAGKYVKTPRLTGARGKERAGRGLLTSSGAEHRRQRLLMQPLFHQQIVERFGAVIECHTVRAMDAWRTGDTVDVARTMSDLAMTILMGVLFGIDYHDQDGALADAIRTRRRYTDYVYHSHLPFREVLPTPTVKANRGAIDTLDRIIYDAIAARRARPGSDMVSLLMQATYADGSRMTDRQVRDEVLTLTSTGHETIGDALGWTWYLLGQHPQVEERLQMEARHLLGGKPAAAADFFKLRYTGMVLSESMRLFPPTWIYTRVPLANDRLPSKREVRKGWTLYLCPYVMHRHPDYFPDPERFDPERFSEAAQERSRPAYFPFGGGPHTCIGEMLARLEGVLVLATIAQRIRFDFPPDPPRIVPKAGVTLLPKNGISMRVTRRA